MLRLNHSNSKSVISCTVVDESIVDETTETWPNEKQEAASPEQLMVNENTDPDCNRSL